MAGSLVHRSHHPGQSSSSQSHLNIIQHNCNHSYTATEHLRINIQSHDIHISLLQEPYYLKDKIIGFSITDIIIQHHSKPRAAIIIHSKSFDTFPTHISRDIIAVHITSQTINCYLLSVYAPPHDDIDITITKIRELISQYHPTPVLIGGDFNAKNIVWGGERTDSRGCELAQFIIASDLYPLNSSTSPPTFESTNGHSWIDLTLTSSNILREITNWTVLDEPTGSDHKYIFFQAYKTNTTTTKKLTQAGQLKLLETLSTDTWFINTQTIPITSRTHLAHIINIFYTKIRTLYNKYCKAVQNSKNQTPWWTPQLDSERKRVRALRRRYQRAPPSIRHTYKEVYLAGLKVYKNNIKIAKTQSWQSFCTQVSRTNIFTLPYKIALNKIKKNLS